jgi:hypothetical protein
MRGFLRSCLLPAVAAFTFLGCYSVTGERLRLDSLRLPLEARVLLCEAVRDVFSHEIRPFRGEIELPGINILDPPEGQFKGFSLNRLVRDMIKETAVDMVLIISPVPGVKRQYNPYSVFRGWRKKTYMDGTAGGRPIYRTIDEPEFETQFEHKCVRITYRLFQYDKAGELTGTMDVARTPFQGCPEKTDRDIYFDDFDYLRSWLKNHISAQ